MYKFKEKSVVCFFGDSITHEGLFIRSIYEYYLNSLHIPCEFFNCGVAGNSTEKGFNIINDTVLAHKPTDVVIAFGMNDIDYGLYDGREVTDEVIAQRRSAIDSGLSYIKKCADTLRKNNINIIFCTPTPYDELSEKEAHNNEGSAAALKEFSDRVHVLAKDYGDNVVDFNSNFYTIMKKLYKENYSLHNDDRVHPNKEGHELMAQIFLRAQGFNVDLSDSFEELEKISNRDHSEWENHRFDLEKASKAADFIIYCVCNNITDEIEIKKEAKALSESTNPFVADCGKAYIENYNEILEKRKQLIEHTKKGTRLNKVDINIAVRKNPLKREIYMEKTKYRTDIVVASSFCKAEAKDYADFVCSGKNDEVTIQMAIDKCVSENKNLLLLNGKYMIDGFHDFGDNGPFSALCFPNAHREITFMGQNHEYGFQKDFDSGVVLYVTKKALNTIGEDSVDVVRSTWTQAGIQNDSNLHIENISVVLADNKHKIRCIDLRRTDRVEAKNVSMISYGDMMDKSNNVGLVTPPPVPKEGCIGLTMTDGSNYNYSNYTNVHAWGFDEGIQVGGEHVVCVNCGATIGRYGFTFGNYDVNCGANHPITLINCLDERNINLPLFNMCGDGDVKGGRLHGEQEVTLISFNIERVACQTPGGVLGDLMREVIPGTWKGNIDFTAQPAWCHLNEKNFKIWESDGSGSGIKTRNNCHKQICGTKERLEYYPTFGQQIFDTDLNKMLICIDPDAKKWVDFNGKEV